MISSLAVQVLLWNLSDYDGGSLLNSEHGGGLAKTPILAASTKLQVSGGLCIGTILTSTLRSSLLRPYYSVASLIALSSSNLGISSRNSWCQQRIDRLMELCVEGP